jgi:Family of unknown function (DUF5309)
MSIVNPGLMHSSNINTSQKVRDVSSTIAFLAPRIAQLLFLTARVAPAPFQQAQGIQEGGAKSLSLGVRTVTNFNFEWMEDAMKSTTTQVNNGAGYTNADTAIVVDDASIFAVNDIVDCVRTGEILMVTAVNVGTNTLTIARSWGATAAAALVDNDYLLIVGNAYSEASSYTLNPVKITVFKSNYIQDSRHAFAGTFVLDKHELYGGDQRSYLRNKFLVQHQQYMEASLIFGEKNDGTGADGSPKKSTSGLLEFQASNNVVAVGGALSKNTWYSWLKDVFTYGSNEKIVIGSPTVINAISNFAADNTGTPKSQMWVMNNARDFGLNVMTYTTKFGIVHLIMHGMFTGAVYDGYAMAIDPAKLQLTRVRNGFFMNLREDIVMDGAHRWVDEYASYFGLEYRNPETGGLLTGVTG